MLQRYRCGLIVSILALFLMIFTLPVLAVYLPSHAEVTEALKGVVQEPNGGFGFHMWATIVDRDGVVKVVTFSGEHRGDQWPGGRVISAQKANTANAFSLPKLALSTANLFSAVKPGGSLYGLQFSNPVDVDIAYRGRAREYGTDQDPMVGLKIGGVNIFGGGLPLYTEKGKLVGALGVSGDNSCADHIIAWKLRHKLKLDHVPAGVSPTQDDNMINDFSDGTSAGGWGHPQCSEKATEIAKGLPVTHPIRVKNEKDM